MLHENIITRIALLEEQIENLERSGYFTEKEMDSQTFALREEIKDLQKIACPIEAVLGVSEGELSILVGSLKECFSSKKTIATSYGMTRESYSEGARKHTEYFSQQPSPALINTWNTLGRNLAISKG